jgi:hypothetical protein
VCPAAGCWECWAGGRRAAGQAEGWLVWLVVGRTVCWEGVARAAGREARREAGWEAGWQGASLAARRAVEQVAGWRAVSLAVRRAVEQVAGWRAVRPAAGTRVSPAAARMEEGGRSAAAALTRPARFGTRSVVTSEATRAVMIIPRFVGMC